MFKEENPFRPESSDHPDDRSNVELLSDRDIEVIRHGLQVFWEKYKEYPPESLPESVMFTETSARPFAYAFRPVLGKLYGTKGVAAPTMGFIVTKGGIQLGRKLMEPGFDWESWLEEQEKEIREDALPSLHKDVERYGKQLNDFDKGIRMRDPDFPEMVTPWDREGRNYFVKNIERCKRRIAELPGWPWRLKRTYEAMVAKIRSEAERLMADGKAPNILFVDEHVYRAGTLRMLEAASGEVSRGIPGLKTEYFAFVDTEADTNEAEDQDFREMLGERYLAGDVGSSEEFGFFTDKDKAKIIGVTKTLGEPLVSRAESRDLEKMRLLRDLMRKIGEDTAKDLDIL